MKYFLLSKGQEDCFKLLRCCPELIQNSFLPFTIREWNNLDPDVRNVDTYLLFHKNLLAFIRPIENGLYSIYDPIGIKILNRLRLGFNLLHERKFKHSFADTVNPLFSCSLGTESTKHYFLCCHNYVTFYTTPMNELNIINHKLNTLEPNELVTTIHYGDKNFDNDSNLKILTLTINFIKQTQRIEQALY